MLLNLCSLSIKTQYHETYYREYSSSMNTLLPLKATVIIALVLCESQIVSFSVFVLILCKKRVVKEESVPPRYAVRNVYDLL